jgi:hypothetical protein
MKFKINGLTKYIGIVTIIYLIAIYLFSININPIYTSGMLFWITYLFLVGIGIFSSIITTFPSSIRSYIVEGKTYTYNRHKLDMRNRTFQLSLWLMILPTIIYLALLFMSSPLFWSKAYTDQLGTSTTKKLMNDMELMDITQLPIVDKELAYKLADKKLGEKPSLGSQVTLGEPTIQQVKGKLIWVVPLEHSGLFKWLFNKEGTPGYITISASNPKEIEYIDKYNIKYQPAAYFNEDLTRKVRFSVSAFEDITDYSFKLNDEGEPFWVVSIYNKTKVLALDETVGIAIVNAQTGEVKRYGLDEIPNWVDRVQPRRLIANQINNRGKYIHGVFNFSNKDKYQTSDNSVIVYYNNNCYMFTGLTSVGTDESATGFILVNLKTKESIIYEMGGATEYSAQQSAEGKVQHLGYRASFPLVANINGIPTYFMTLKDKEGLIKQYAFVSVRDYTSVGVGESIDDALLAYKQATRDSSSDIDESDENKVVTITDTIERMAVERTNQTTIYKIILTNHKDKMFVFSYDISNELAITRENDNVTISYYESADKVIDGKEFNNNNYSIE